jgi:hypothetical protein
LDQESRSLLQRIAQALERLAPPAAVVPDLSGADAFVWQAAAARLAPVAHVARVEAGLLCGIDQQKSLLIENTSRFAAGRPANNAMLWGARGMGKSSLVKAAHAATIWPVWACCSICCGRSRGAACCSATICRSSPRTPATRR